MDVKQAPVLAAVEVTIDGLLVLADALGGIGSNFPLVCCRSFESDHSCSSKVTTCRRLAI